MTPEQLQAWRLDRNLTQAQLAAALGVRMLAVSRWERGLRGIPGPVPVALRALEREMAPSLASPPSVGPPRPVADRPRRPGRPRTVGLPAPAS